MLRSIPQPVRERAMTLPEDAHPITRVPYATLWEESKGRLFVEPPSKTRTPFQRDRDRIIHCAAFRRLMHKTQVFVAPEVDHVRTRLTHSLEVSQIARSMARTLGLDEDLTEVLALSHDLGHPPFGHSGEDALNEAMHPYGGYDHNDQSLRIVVRLERRYPDFDGLNLTWETLEGLVKHNGPLIGEGPKAFASEAELPSTIRRYNRKHDLCLSDRAGLEAQLAAIADDVAYNHHDMDDGLRSGLFSIDEVSSAVPHVGAAFAEVSAEFGEIEDAVVISEGVRRLIGDMVHDVLHETGMRLNVLQPESVEDVRRAGQTMVAFSSSMAEKERALKNFLFDRMYRNERVNEARAAGKATVRGLFKAFMDEPDLMPVDWFGEAQNQNEGERARVVADYIAGMTDRYARREWKRIGGILD